MTDKRFWEIVESIGWDMTGDYETSKVKLLKNMTYTELTELQSEYGNRISLLCSLPGIPDRCCDSWSDCTAHIVGLGRAEFVKHCENIQLIEDRYESGEFIESFSYALPNVEDLVYLTNTYYAQSAYVVETGEGIEDGELDTQHIPSNVRRLQAVVEAIQSRSYVDAVKVYDENFPDGNRDPIWGACETTHLLPNIIRNIKQYKID